MSKLSLALAFGFGAVCLASSAYADRAAADKCAAKLDANGKKIYQASAPSIAPGADIRSVVTDQTKALVMGGTISRSAAKPAAEAAGSCLAMINS
ncbi:MULTISPECIES: hypothetical protein [Azorhizobium]|nr:MULTISPECIES: hypothetical protein [Azorhizobium]TDT94511.1 hypothetical protein DFO45_2260 [Azorhizobium sp. AG788]